MTYSGLSEGFGGWLDTRPKGEYHLTPLRGGPLAQVVEHRTFNPKVAGSSPARPTMDVGVWWPHSLRDRTPVFQAGGGGSSPPGATTIWVGG